MTKKFDLNIEKVLEDWEIYHRHSRNHCECSGRNFARDTKAISIYKDERNNWHIRDYGRGLRYVHLTQKENEEKTASLKLIGKFGVGLKDALATFDRRSIGVLVRSPHGDITLQNRNVRAELSEQTRFTCV